MALGYKTKNWIIGIISAIVVGVVVFSFFAYQPQKAAAPQGAAVNVIAAENFWGSLLAQVGGSDVHVTSIITDPNADPHEFASSAATARQFATAQYVVINGAGYDIWANKLLSANPSSGRTVLNVATLLGKKTGDNPHFWYSPTYVNKVILQMRNDLIKIDPAHTADYKANYTNLVQALTPYQARINEIKQKFGGTKVASTESIFVYLAEATGLDLVSPPAFMNAVSEGNSPSPQDVITFENQLTQGTANALVYNKQTTTPLTQNMEKIANAHGVPIVGITETMEPPTTTFQHWMNLELVSLENALLSRIQGQ